MAITSVSKLSPHYPERPGSAVAIDLVEERFILTREYAEDAQSVANEYLVILRQLFANASMPEHDIDYDIHSLTLGSGIEDKRPDSPTDDQLTPTRPDSPSLGDLQSITIPSIDIPSEDFGDLKVSFNYDETSYSSDLIDAVKVALQDYVESGGTGLGAAVEAAIWARAQARQELDNERVYNEALNYFVARGFIIPPGALTGRLLEAVAEQTRANAQLNYEIMIEQAKLAQTNTHKALEFSVGLEGVEKDFANKVANRAFEKAKAACDVITNTYTAKVTAYVARVEASKAKAAVAKTVVEAQAAANKNVVDIFVAELDKYKADLALELSVVESIAKVYGYKVMGYEADAKVAIGVMEEQIKLFEASIKQTDNQTQLSLKEAEIVMGAYLSALSLQEEAIRGGATIAAQLAASALNSVNASANLGYSVGRQQTESTGHNTQISNVGSLSESHTYSHEA